MRIDDYKRGTLLLDQIEKCNEIKARLSKKYHEVEEDDLKVILSQSNDAIAALRDKYQQEFDEL